MYLYGASGHAKVIIDILRANNEKLEALFDDNEAIDSLLNYPVLRSSEVRGPLIISIGDNGIRRKIAESLHATFGNAFHPSAIKRRYGRDAGNHHTIRCLYRQALYYQYWGFCGS